jgi:hypothetical protein
MPANSRKLGDARVNLRFEFVAVIMTILWVPEAVLAEESVLSMEEDKVQVRAWNRFADQLYALQKKIIAAHQISTTEESGRYGGDFAKRFTFREVTYRDAESDRLLGVLRRAADKPENLEIISAYIYDKTGRVERDYAAIYLPWGRNAPIRTFINLHQYRGGLHGYRQFDASDNLLYEECRGKLNGAEVDISLESYQIRQPIVSTDAYRHCFDGLPQTAGEYLTPH